MASPHSSVGKESAYNAGDPGLIPGLGRSHGEGNGNPLQYSCLENPVDRGAWQATVHGVTRVGHDLATKPPSPYMCLIISKWRRQWHPTPYSCLENPMDRRAWQVTVHGVTRVGHDLVTKPPPSPKQVQDGFWDFLGSPVVKTLHFQCRGHGFSSWFGN